MREQNHENHLAVAESEHEYEAYLDVIKLPLPILIEDYSPAPQFLFTSR